MNYKVYQGDELKQTVASKTAVMNGLQPNHTYEFGIQPNNGKLDGTKVTKSVTTRGIRFNIPKTLTVGSTITLRYEEYPLGIVPIGGEPSGMFGGGNKQNLSAKVISTANGSSVVEVGGNVIEVGGRNLLINTSSSATNGQTVMQGSITKVLGVYSRTDSYEQVTAPSSGEFYYRFMYPDANKLYGLAPGETYTLSGSASLTSGTLQARTQYHNGSGWIDLDYLTDLGIHVSDGLVFKPFSYTFTIPVGATGVYFSLQNYDYTNGSLFRFKNMNLEQGDIATPYASFVDGDTFTKQSDGKFALFSEHKALYY